MDMMSAQVVAGLLHALEPMNVLVMVIGLAVGIVGGMLPGITVVTTIALFIPFTFSMAPATALLALGAIYCGATYGGANAAILINTPGQPGSIATTFDGYQMTRKGEAEKGLYTALLASCCGGVVGAVLLLLFFEPLSGLALKFGSEAFFWMAVFGLTTLAAMSPGQVMKSLLAGLTGLALSTVGLDPSDGFPRFTFDNYDLVQGLDMVVLMTSLFSFSQMLLLLESRDDYIADFIKRKGAFTAAAKALFGRCKLLVTVSSVLGTFIGGLPGAGGSVASIITYNEAKRWDKHPERYGTGIVEGIAVPESANNASVGGALVPMLALGIPGSASAAVLMGGLLAQGLTPGPSLLEKNGEIAYTFIAGLIVVNFFMVAVGYVLARGCARILDVRKMYIIPTVIVLSMLGAYSLRNSLFDVLVLLLSGGAAYLCLKAGIQPACIALGVVLGPIIEESLVTTLMRARSEDSVWDLLLFSPLSMTFLVLSAVSLALPVFLQKRKQTVKERPRQGFALHSANLCRYDFWLIAVLVLLGGFFLRESLALDGTAGLFPTVVFSGIVLLGLWICLQILAAPVMPRQLPDWRSLLPIVVIFSIAVASYLLINVLGFYSAVWLCILVMLGYMLARNREKKASVGDWGRALLFSLAVTGILYLCFSLLLHVPTPRGALI